jgi:hypothetical protein
VLGGPHGPWEVVVQRPHLRPAYSRSFTPNAFSPASGLQKHPAYREIPTVVAVGSAATTVVDHVTSGREEVDRDCADARRRGQRPEYPGCRRFRPITHS